jgi:hypothetical protein
MTKLPAFHFYPGDWLRDGVAGCSLEAQGLWLRMLIVMHDAETYGYLVINGSAMDSAMIARRCGCSLKQYEAVLTELDEAGVPSRTETGIIYSRRMVRDAEERAQNAERQRKFRSKTHSNGNVTHVSQQSNTPLHSSSSSSMSKKKVTTDVVTKKEAATTKPIDEDFLQQLQESGAYKHANVELEFAKAKVWCANNNREPTRKFFIGWLNRIHTNGGLNGKSEDVYEQRINNTNRRIEELEREARAELAAMEAL